MNVDWRTVAAITILALGLSVVACGGGGGGANVFAGRDPSVSFSAACQKSDQKQFSKPDSVIDTSKTYIATIKTDKGDIVVQLFSDTPVTANNFVFLACKGFYDGLTFHRVLENFMAQGGDPLGTGGGGPGYTIPDEGDGGHKMEPGVISMAKSGPNTTGSQFFVTTGLGAGGSLAYLDPDFTVFGKVTQGMDVLKQITLRDPNQKPTFAGDKINTITITEK